LTTFIDHRLQALTCVKTASVERHCVYNRQKKVLDDTCPKRKDMLSW